MTKIDVQRLYPFALRHLQNPSEYSLLRACADAGAREGHMKKTITFINKSTPEEIEAVLNGNVSRGKVMRSKYKKTTLVSPPKQEEQRIKQTEKPNRQESDLHENIRYTFELIDKIDSGELTLESATRKFIRDNFKNTGYASGEIKNNLFFWYAAKEKYAGRPNDEYVKKSEIGRDMYEFFTADAKEQIIFAELYQPGMYEKNFPFKEREYKDLLKITHPDKTNHMTLEQAREALQNIYGMITSPEVKKKLYAPNELDCPSSRKPPFKDYFEERLKSFLGGDAPNG